jgi:transcription elongation factor S-II
MPLIMMPPAPDQILKRARGIESSVLSLFETTSQAYKAKIRSLFVNLKDKNNPGLRESVVSGDISVDRLSKMSSEVTNFLI